MAERRYSVLGDPVRVLATDDEVAAEIDRVMNGLETTTRAARAAYTFHVVAETSGYVVYRDCLRRGAGAHPGAAVVSLVATMNQAILDRCPNFAVHAGVVTRDRMLVALPAESGGGKSTLVAACLQSGFGYVSDEALVLDDEGRVIPYPKPIALTPWGRRRLGVDGEGEESLHPATAMGSGPDPAGRPVSDIVVIERGHHGVELDPLPRSEGVSALLSHSFNHYKDPERAFRLATETARRARVWSLRYRDPVEAAQVLGERLPTPR